MPMRKGKIVPFNGGEQFVIWYEQFKACTPGMSKGDRLKELLPAIKGEAAEFVFDQLPKRTLKDYSALVKELKKRFNKVESARTYRARLSKLKQKNESPLDFANELKRVYDKAR